MITDILRLTSHGIDEGFFPTVTHRRGKPAKIKDKKVLVVYNKDEVKQKYGDISFDEIRDIIWNRIKNEVNTTVPRYKHIMNMILTDKELIKTTTKKVKRNEELKEILKNYQKD